MPTAPGYAACAVKLQCTGLNRPAYVTFGVNPTSTDPAIVAAAIKTAWYATGAANSRLDSEVTATEFIARLGTDGGEDLVGSVAGGAAGGLSSTLSPTPNVAILIHKRTARGGRRGRGRIFFPWCVSETQLEENGSLNSTAITGIQTAMTTWWVAHNTNDVPMVVLHRPSLVNPAPPGPPDPVTGLLVDPLVSTQKRRLGRR
jgi:hypothetical protein